VIDPINQKNPLHPDQTSVSVARRCERQKWPAQWPSPGQLLTPRHFTL
jgi:hypothetical protein